MRVVFNNESIDIKDYSFKSPTVGAVKSDEPDGDNEHGYYFFCLKQKIAMLLHKNKAGKLEVVSSPIKIKNGELWIKYQYKDKWEPAGPISQDKYRTIALEEALRKIK